MVSYTLNSLKLQRQRAYEKKGQTYYKYTVNLPPKIVEKLGWKEGTKLTAETKNSRLVLRAS